MVNIITEEIPMDKELKTNLKFICEFRDKMWENKEKRDKYYPIVYELYDKNIFDNEQMQVIHDTKTRSSEMDSNQEKDDYEIS